MFFPKLFYTLNVVYPIFNPNSVSDVGGAQSCGLRGILVRTGKYRSTDESHPKVKPDKIVDNLAEIVNILLNSNE